MRRTACILSLAAMGLGVGLLALGLATAPARGEGSGPLVWSVALDADIQPASADWVSSALDSAKDAGADLVIVRLDTPGGLDTSMRKIIKKFIAAPMPVVVYVSPQGGRAASAGLFITEGADVAAMAPQTNIGSATPITIGPGTQDEVLGRKIRNDAAAFVRALAEAHGRNPDLAEQMVRKATNVEASVALERGLIDLVAADQGDLLRQLDGFRVKGPKAQTLHTAGARVVTRDIPLKYGILGFLVNPNVAFLLLIGGALGLAFELMVPGHILPGALGSVALLLAMYGLFNLPVNAAGILLIALALGLFIAEGFIMSHGALAVGGVVALIAGGLLLFDTNSDTFKVSLPIVIAAAAGIGGFFVLIMGKALAARRQPVHAGREELVGQTAVVRSPLNPTGQVFVQGALWRARSEEGPIGAGAKVVVDSVEGLTLDVHRPTTNRRPADAAERQTAAAAQEGESP